ncbi:micrococcal nuclease-like nuclease (plasmid) [Nostoc sp. PCC 7524]|uniref:thermonuclease family protein n=1 Tax=Nostoc sp. (strain ATCC 29411 / PCC 7524) TaxID=28072 RepID=UPI00029F2783|nr:thermonuclease family protein [Nostoc sp. PCC 7524]AFY51357.1 micrococcal nuclease-like nuclease [Nostoc sp. PCC 7524]
MKVVLHYKTKIYIAILLGVTTGISGCEILSGSIGESLANANRQFSESWEVVRISDGDSIVVRRTGEEKKIRLCGIDAPESKQPLGKESKANLERLSQEVGGQVSIVSVESDRYGRLVAEVFSSPPNKDNIEKFWNEEQLSSGNAYLYKQYVGKCHNKIALEKAEEIGKSKKLGVWAGNYQKPWDYRRAQRNR